MRNRRQSVSKRFGIVCAAWFATVVTSVAALSVSNPKCEYFENPLGVDVTQPRLFWNLTSKERCARQTAYQILVATSPKLLAKEQGDLWDTGKVISDETLHIRYAGAALKSSQQVFWKVRSWDENDQPSAWSKAATWTMGVLSSADWAGAQWLGVNDTNVPNVLLRREFTARPGLQRALVHVCGLGHYELLVNGKKSGTDLLAPGWTKYDKTCLYETHDVTKLLSRGGNAVGITLGNGMYNSIGGGRYTKFKGSFGGQKAIAQIRLEYNDGSTDIVVTDTQWRMDNGPITFGTVFGGEDFDARLVQRGWAEPKFDDAKWQAAQMVDGPGGQLRGLSCSAPPLREIEVLKPVTINRLTNDIAVYDFGQNAPLIARFKVRGAAGASVRAIPAELVTTNGYADRSSCGGRRGDAYWKFTLAGAGRSETWMPQFFYHGSRYFQVELSPAPGESQLPVVESLEGVVVHSVSEPIGEFACSNDLFNRIRTLIRWAQRANMVSVLTDCPHREKLGWLEEYHLNGPAIRYEFDLSALFTKSMNDMADSQLPEGLVPTTAPEYTIFRDKGDTVNLRGIFGDSPEWGSANLLVPWQQFEFAGDLEMLRRNYDTMKRYVAFLSTRATNNILSHGLGDWYDIGPNPPGVSQLTPIALPATAFYFYDHWILAQAAGLLGKPDEAKQFAAQAEAIRRAFNDKFFDATKKTYATGSQAANAIPLVMGIVEPANRVAVVDAIVADVRARGNALTAGDVGYRYLLRALADGGRSDVIFDINNQSDKPGYGYQLKMGATSLTEAWDARRQSSHNHFMLGQINEWFYHDLAGIGCDVNGGPGFREIVIRPQPVGDVNWVRASLNSMRGRIACDWKRGGGKFVLNVAVPTNAKATLWLPSRTADTVRESGKPVERSAGVRWLRQEGDRTVFAIESGKFEFESSW